MKVLRLSPLYHGIQRIRAHPRRLPPGPFPAPGPAAMTPAASRGGHVAAEIGETVSQPQ